MGSPASEPERNDNEVLHRVTVSGFYMGKYAVTQKEWKEVMGTNPSNFNGDNLPVEQISWYEAVEYCNRRSHKERLPVAYRGSGAAIICDFTAGGYRLPTEAEWEYACRAGTATPFNTGNNITTGQANYNGNYPYNGHAKGTDRAGTMDVGSFAPNSWGLYDMHGNVWEWCWDRDGMYFSGAQMNPMGASSGSYRVIRGGSWNSVGQFLRSALRYDDTPSNRNITLGFRLARPSL
jgi:formylglycine-generating enzyme required for sulfatase activity